MAYEDGSSVGVPKIPDGECAPAVFLAYMLLIIFNKSLLKHSLRCSSGHETNRQKKT